MGRQIVQDHFHVNTRNVEDQNEPVHCRKQLPIARTVRNTQIWFFGKKTLKNLQKFLDLLESSCNHFHKFPKITTYRKPVKNFYTLPGRTTANVNLVLLTSAMEVHHFSLIFLVLIPTWLTSATRS